MSNQPITTPLLSASDKALLAGLTMGRNVHYVLASGEHRPAQVLQVPGILATVSQAEDELEAEVHGAVAEIQGEELADPDSGVVSLTVFLAPTDEFTPGESGELIGYAPGAPFDPTGKTPNTWHWIERA